MTATMIRLDTRTRDRLQKYKLVKHDTYDEIMIRLMNKEDERK